MAKLKLEIPEERTKLTLKLKESAIEILKDYTKYASGIHNANVSMETVVESLVENLLKDRDFYKSRSLKAKKNIKGASSKEALPETKNSNTEATV